MAFTLTSITGTVDTNEVVFERLAKGAARGVGIMAYLDYTKNGDTLQVQMAYNEIKINQEFYQEIAVVNDALEVIIIDIGASGKYRLPIGIADNEDSVKLTFLGGVDGTLNVEFRQDQGHK